ncbi:MAG: AGE family epimerase/isomerase [bacterium]
MSLLEHPASYATELRRTLTEDIVPFWDRHALDPEYGGIFTGLDRQGFVIETDKSIWFQGRATWLYAHLAMSDLGTEEDRTRWYATAAELRAFLNRYGYDSGAGRYRFRVSRTGAPLITRRYLFSDCFACLANAAFARATATTRTSDDDVKTSMDAVSDARRIYHRILWYRENPSALTPKIDPATRPSRGFALPMILINVLQELRAADPSNAHSYTRQIDALVEEVALFLDWNRRCVLEQVNPDGTPQNHFEGRLLNPGHAIEAAWFILEEARHRTTVSSEGVPGLRTNTELIDLGTRMLDWMWEWGWDTRYGGVLYFRDAGGYDSPEYWHDMKFWWPQCEAILATHYAYLATRNPRYAEWHERAYTWAVEHLPDTEYGEWYGYLHRDGSVSSSLKGTLYKGPYHVPRMYLVSIALSG